MHPLHPLVKPMCHKRQRTPTDPAELARLTLQVCLRAMEDITRLQSQMQGLLQQECYDSAEILGSLMMCRSKAVAADLPASGLGSHADSLVLYADALYGKGEYRRALTHYKQAEQHRRLGGGSRNRQVAQSLDPIAEAELKFKECKCYAKLDDAENALRCMAGVGKHRSLQMHLFVASLQRGLRKHREAVLSYKAALKCNPMALEAVTALAQLGVSQPEIWSTVGKASHNPSNANQSSQPSPAYSLPPPPPSHFSQTQGFHDSSGLRTPGTHTDPAQKGSGSPCPPLSPKDLAWLEVFVAAHAAAHAHVPLEAINKFNELEAWFRQSLHCLLHRAKLQFDADLQHEAEKTFDKAREADGECIDVGDYHALLLRQKGGAPQLSALAHRLMAMDQKRPEPWVAAALYCDLRGDREKALVLVERALQLQPQHVLAYHVKGSLLLTLARPELAIHTFLAAKELSKDVHSFKGLVDAYLAAHRYKEALGAAKDAVQAIPKNAHTVTLVGQVLATLPDGAEKGKKAFQRALVLQPLHADAILSLADLYMSSGEYDRCIELLGESLKQLSHLDYLHTKLGDVYTLTEDFSDALAAYHHAISINPSSTEAQVGLERLEKLMRGADPDAEEAVEMAAEDAY